MPNNPKYQDCSCKACGFPQEDEKHIFEDCPAYIELRHEAFSKMLKIQGRTFSTLPTNPTLETMKAAYLKNKPKDKVKKLVKTHIVLALNTWKTRNLLSH